MSDQPIAWGMPRPDGLILDVICPEEHAREPGQYTVPLYAAPQPKAGREWPHVWGCRANAFGECDKGCIAPQPKAEPQEPVLYVHPSTYAMESANQIGVWRPGCQLDDYLPLYFAPPAPQPRRRLTREEIVDAVREADLDWHRGWTLDEDALNRYETLCRVIEAAVWGEAK
jgi:hypothetical protein